MVGYCPNSGMRSVSLLLASGCAFFFWGHFLHIQLSVNCVCLSHSVLQSVAIGASSGGQRCTRGFTTLLLREKHISEGMSVKGEQGGGGGRRKR